MCVEKGGDTGRDYFNLRVVITLGDPADVHAILGLPSVATLCIPPKKLPILLLIPKNFTHYSLKFSNYSQYFTYYSQILIPETQHVMQKYYWGEPERAPH